MNFDVIILGAGASGLMCGIEAGRRGRRCLILDHNPRAGSKVLIAGGGKCNFTNLNIDSGDYVSENPHFCKSAISRFTPWDFIGLLEKHRVPWEERDHGQLFGVDGSRDILNVLLSELKSSGAELKTGREIGSVGLSGTGGFLVSAGGTSFRSESLVVATGGLSWPGVGAGPLGYRIAAQFGMPVVTPSPGLVPLTFNPADKARFAPLTGIAVEAEVSTGGKSFRESMLFTHRGLSGPCILQISNFWLPGNELLINLLPGVSVANLLDNRKPSVQEITVKNCLSARLPKRLLAAVLPPALAERPLKSLSPSERTRVDTSLSAIRLRPNGTEGYKKAEVTRGGVDTAGVSSKTFETAGIPGLFFIGEVLDVTGRLGGYNLQWAWSSGWCAGQYV